VRTASVGYTGDVGPSIQVAAVLVISFEDPATLRRFHWFRDLPFTVVSDTSRRLYRAFGLGRGSLTRLFDRETIRSYARGFVHGHLPVVPRGDLRQLGGDVVLDRAGEAVLVYRSKTPLIVLQSRRCCRSSVPRGSDALN
jgi:hypothetical protein